MFGNISRALVLAPHTDDGEFGAGGTIASMVRQGIDVHYVAFSACQDSIPEGWPKDVLLKEVREATAIMGIPEANLRVLDFVVRRFDSHRQDILQSMVDLNRELRPDLVLMPSREDLHQDHLTVAQEGLRAFKRTSILAYEIPWNTIQFPAEGFVSLSEDDVRTKLEAVTAYQSQADRPYASAEYLRSHLVTRGLQIGCDYAEAFNVVRWVMG